MAAALGVVYLLKVGGVDKAELLFLFHGGKE